MNYQLLREDKCPYCEQKLTESFIDWKDREFGDNQVEAVCMACNIHYEYISGVHFLIRKLNSNEALIEYFDIDKGVLQSEKLLPESKSKIWAYNLPDGSAWKRPYLETVRLEAIAKERSLVLTTEELKIVIDIKNEP